MTTYIPQIPSGALPQTPAKEWADGLTDTLDGHHTKTPVTTPGPKVPGGWNDDVETPNSDSARILPTQEDLQRAFDNAKTYLPQGVAAYLPGNTTSETSTSGVDVGHGASVPYTEAGAQPYSAAPNSNSNDVDLHPASTTYTASGAEPYGATAGAGSDLGQSAAVPDSTNGTQSLTAGFASAAQTAKAYVPDSVAVANAAQMAKAYVPESVAAYLPGTTTPAAAAKGDVSLHPASTEYTPSGPAPYGSAAGAGSDLGAAAAPAVDTGVSMHPASTTYTKSGAAPYGSAAGAGSDLGSSSTAPAADTGVSMHPASTTYTPSGPAPYGATAGAGSDLGSAAAAVATASSTKALPDVPHTPSITTPSSAMPTPGSMTVETGHSTPQPKGTPGLLPSHPAASDAHPHEAYVHPTPAPKVGVTGSAALNSTRLQDTLPTGADEGAGRRSGSASRFREVVSSSEGHDELDADAEGEEDASGEEDGEGEHDGEGGKKRGRFMKKVKKVLGRV